MLPSESLPMRQALANAIYQTGCSVDCVRNVLYFEERMWRGDRPAEETAPIPEPGLSEKEKELQTSLDETLRKHKPELGVVLEKVYGLNTSFPSPFAVEVVTRLGVTEACPLLMRTYLTVQRERESIAGIQERSWCCGDAGLQDPASSEPAVGSRSPMVTRFPEIPRSEL